jgi:hypothetical protein
MNTLIEKAMTEGPEEWDMLNERQQSLAESYTKTALEYGMFNQTSFADGAHYAPAAVNPFKKTGMMCQNCLFFAEGANQCMIVAGMIEPEAICKLWVIPESKINEPGNPSEEDPAMSEKMNKWTGSAFDFKQLQ